VSESLVLSVCSLAEGVEILWAGFGTLELFILCFIELIGSEQSDPLVKFFVFQVGELFDLSVCLPNFGDNRDKFMLFRLQRKILRWKLISISIEQTEVTAFDDFVGVVGHFDQLLLVGELDDLGLEGNYLFVHV
jgi:hypothetical protein